jgi:hypothetical protein
MTSLDTNALAAGTQKARDPEVSKLWRLSIKAMFLRLRHDLASELTVLAATGILCALFFYMFNDFINVQIKSISDGMRQKFGHFFGLSLCMIGALLAGRLIGEEDDPKHSFTATAAWLGANTQSLMKFRLLRVLTILTATVLLFQYLMGSSFLEHSLPQHVLTTTSMVMVSFAFARWTGNHLKNLKLQHRQTTKLLQAKDRKTLIFNWRVNLLARGLPAGNLAAFLALLMWILNMALTIQGAPAFVLAAAALLTGWLASLPLTFLLAIDLEHSWLDKSSGLTHEEFTSIHKKMALIGATLMVVMHLWPAWVARNPSIAAAAATPLLSLTPIALQLDPRKPAVTALANFLVSLFAGTAVIAHIGGLAALVVLWFWGHDAQRGRFYRA